MKCQTRKPEGGSIVVAVSVAGGAYFWLGSACTGHSGGRRHSEARGRATRRFGTRAVSVPEDGYPESREIIEMSGIMTAPTTRPIPSRTAITEATP